MAKEKAKPVGVRRGTVDLLILRVLELQRRHGVAIAERVEQVTRGECALGPGSLFPALHRLELRRWLTSQWDETDNAALESGKLKVTGLWPGGQIEST